MTQKISAADYLKGQAPKRKVEKRQNPAPDTEEENNPGLRTVSYTDCTVMNAHLREDEAESILFSCTVRKPGYEVNYEQHRIFVRNFKTGKEFEIKIEEILTVP